MQATPAGQDLYSSAWRRDRFIGAARLILASVSLAAVWFNPARQGQSGSVLRALLLAYVLYSGARLYVVLHNRAPLRYPIAAHLLDVLLLSSCIVLNTGLDAPLYSLFSFSIVSATLRWGRRGVLFTAASVLLVSAVAELYGNYEPAARFVFNDFAVRLATVGSIAVLLGELGAYESRTRREFDQLVRSPELGHDADEVVSRLLCWAAELMHAPRIAIAWEEDEEPWTHLAWWQQGNWGRERLEPGLLDPFVAEQLTASDFVCARVDGAPRTVVYTAPGGFPKWVGTPLNPKLQERFSVVSTLSVRFESETASGRLFVFDKSQPRSDDLVLGRLLAQHIASHLNHLNLHRRLAERAAPEERLRLARDLHDGALQALAGAGFELERLARMPELQQSLAQSQLRAVQKSLEAEQRALREVIRDLRADGFARDSQIAFPLRMKELVERAQRQWAIQVKWSTAGVDRLPAARAKDVYLLVHEALVNAARHSGASEVKLDVVVTGEQISIVIADSGGGFSFKGHYDHATLSELQLGPTTLRERAVALGGTLTVDSTARGSQLEIRLPTGPVSLLG